MKDYREVETITTGFVQMIYDKAYERGLKDGHLEITEENNEKNQNICLSCKWVSNYDKCVSCSRLIRKDNFEAN